MSECVIMAKPVLMLPAAMIEVQTAEQIIEEITTMEPITEPVIKEPVTTFETISAITMDGSIFKEIFGSLNALVPECVLNINSSGFNVRCVDIANVALIALEYKKDVFEHFKGPVETVRIGIDVKNIYSLRTMIKKGSLVFMEFIKKTVPAEITEKGNVIDEKITYSYTISIDGTETKDHALDVNTIRREPHEPTMDLKTSIDLKSEGFIQGIKDGSKVSDKVALVYDSGNFSMVFEGNSRKMNKMVSIMSSTTSDKDQRSRSIFSLDYLKDMIKTLNKNEIITLKMGTDFPIKLIRENELRTITFMLAPRIESN